MLEQELIVTGSVLTGNCRSCLLNRKKLQKISWYQSTSKRLIWSRGYNLSIKRLWGNHATEVNQSNQIRVIQRILLSSQVLVLISLLGLLIIPKNMPVARYILITFLWNCLSKNSAWSIFFLDVWDQIQHIQQSDL